MTRAHGLLLALGFVTAVPSLADEAAPQPPAPSAPDPAPPASPPPAPPPAAQQPTPPQATPRQPGAPRTAPRDVWAPLRPLLGKWEGTASGEPGQGAVQREYRLVLRDRFIEVRNTSAYPAQERNPRGEIHEDVGFISYDRARKLFVLRQFHVEGFVNRYTGPGPDASSDPSSAGGVDFTRGVVFTSEAIENIPPGWRARETYRFTTGGELVETFELAGPGRDFSTYTESTLRRVQQP